MGRSERFEILVAFVNYLNFVLAQVAFDYKNWTGEAEEKEWNNIRKHFHKLANNGILLTISGKGAKSKEHERAVVLYNKILDELEAGSVDGDDDEENDDDGYGGGCSEE